MKRNSLFSGLIYFFIASILSFGIYFLMKTKSKKSLPFPKVEASQINGFSDINRVEMKVDTFAQMIKIVYGDLVKIDRNKTLFSLDFINTNQKAKAFYNGNEALLNLKDKKNRFDLLWYDNNKNLLVHFEIQDEGIQVPNDILLPLTKLYIDKLK